MKTVAFLNRKGGVGKTSTCFHLSWALAKLGQRVLLVDLDSQANLSEAMLGLEVAGGLMAKQTVASLFDDTGGPPVRELIMATPYPGIAILPGSDATEDFYVKRPWETGPLQFVLRDALSDVGTAYDLVLMDCPPNLLLPSWASLAASDAVCIPLQPEEFAAGGVAKMDRPIAEARRRINPQLVMIGYLMTMFNKSLLVHTSYEADLRQVYGDDVFRAVVPLAKDFKEAVTLKKPVGVYKPRSAAAKAIAGLAVELLDRLALRTSAIEDVRAA